jgi:hypothetical protein
MRKMLAVLGLGAAVLGLTLATPAPSQAGGCGYGGYGPGYGSPGVGVSLNVGYGGFGVGGFSGYGGYGGYGLGCSRPPVIVRPSYPAYSPWRPGCGGYGPIYAPRPVPYPRLPY